MPPPQPSPFLFLLRKKSWERELICFLLLPPHEGGGVILLGFGWFLPDFGGFCWEFDTPRERCVRGDASHLWTGETRNGQVRREVVFFQLFGGIGKIGIVFYIW